MTTSDPRPLPLVRELPSVPDVELALVRLSRLPHVVLLDSAAQDDRLGRYSFIAADPFEFLSAQAEQRPGVGVLSAKMAPFVQDTMPDLPPFQGGAAGIFSYDLGRSFESVPAAVYDEFRVPATAWGLYDVVLAIDHHESRAWIVSQGFPEQNVQRRVARAKMRLEQFQQWLADSNAAQQAGPVTSDRMRVFRNPVDLSELAPQFPVGLGGRLTSDFRPDQYRRAVARAIQYIHDGDVFQVNLSQRLLHPAADHSVSLYRHLRQRNPAPFAGYFDLGEYQILSASPERFLSIRHGIVETRPIKGTRQRTSLPEADLFARQELTASEKDRAENVMIVDLLRNDLSRVCEPASVRVTELCSVEVYQYVQHLVSAVTGRLRDGCGPLDAVAAAFPGGSVTGAPKVRAMEIISELEPTARGPYCGSMGYLGFDGTMDLNIMIRTITAGRGWWQMPVGGGIVAQSDPDREYDETWHKAEGLLRALPMK